MIEPISQHYPAAAPAAPTEPRPYSKRQELFQELIGDGELLLKNRLEVRHLMSRSPVTVPPIATLEELTALMQKRRLHHLLVCGRGGELLGVVSDRDLRGMRGTTAQQVMSYPPLTCTPDTPLSAAITFLMNENISCLPVVDNGKLCGVLTTTDLVLTLQCTLQLWLRLAQIIQHDPTWSKELEKIAASLDGELTAAQLAERITHARQAIRQEIDHLISSVDLRVDAMTGMANRRQLEEILDLLLGMKKRYGRPFSLAIVRIDHFQRIRQTCGEAVVKSLMRTVAALIEGDVWQSDFVARLRDDAFVVALTEADSERATAFCHRLQDAAGRHTQLNIKLHISVAAVEAEPDDEVGRLLSRAEAAV